MKILFTGFEPFGGEKMNPSWEAVRGLEDSLTLPGETGPAKDPVILAKRLLPVEYGAAGDRLLAAVDEEKPDAVICVGQAGGRKAVTVERVAVNVMDSSAPDNAGRICTDEPVIGSGPAACFSTLPVKEIVRAIQAQGVPAAVSNTAGTFVCNALMYRLLYQISLRFPGMRGGFIHVPYADEQLGERRADLPSLPLTEIRKALAAAAAAAAEAYYR